MILLVLLAENLLFPLAALGVLLRFVFSPRRRVLLNLGEELRERLGGLTAEQLGRIAGRRVLWVHAASAGEVAAVSGLLEKISSGPNFPAVLLTCSTAAGREKARGLSCVDLAVLAPLDCYPAAARFLSRVRPQALLIVETELWPHMIELAFRRGARVALVNGRLTERSFARYRLFAPFVGPFLRRMTFIGAQTEGDAGRFLALGAEPASLVVTGNMKYDQLKALGDPAPAREALARLGWGEAPLLVAGSTHPGEEEQVCEAYLEARRSFPELKLVIAPRHLERAGRAAETLRGRGLRLVLWSQKSAAEADALLLDTLGVLPHFYAHAAVSFVGGTMVPVGGHNLLEPALAGSPVVFGPHTFHTRETARLLESAGCGFRVLDGEGLARVLKDILGDPPRSQALGEQARKTARSLQGATERTLARLGDVAGIAPAPPRG